MPPMIEVNCITCLVALTRGVFDSGLSCGPWTDSAGVTHAAGKPYGHLQYIYRACSILRGADGEWWVNRLSRVFEGLMDPYGVR